MKNLRGLGVTALTVVFSSVLAPPVSAAAGTLVSSNVDSSASSASASPHWRTFSSVEVGLSFRFPIPAGTVSTGYRYSSCKPPIVEPCDGPYYTWTIGRNDPIGIHGYWFAGFTGHVGIGRDSWPTDIASWGRDDKGYWVLYGSNKLLVQPVNVLKAADGSSALIFKPGNLTCPNICSAATFPYLKDRVVVINFSTSHNGFRDLVIYFEDPTPLWEIEESVRSVSFRKLPNTGGGALPLAGIGVSFLIAGLVFRVVVPRTGSAAAA